MEAKVQITSRYIALIDQIRYLLSRQNLCNNTYLYKQMKPNLTIPLFLIVEERKIAAITNNEQEIVAALQQSGLAMVHNQRQVSIIEYPTIKIDTKNSDILIQIEKILKQQNKRYAFTQRIDKKYINLTLYEQENQSFLLELIPKISKQVQFQKTSLYEDIKIGTLRIKKMKQDNKNSIGYVGKTKYSYDKPPQIFIRRAVDSSDEQQKVEKPKRHGNDHKKKYKQVIKEQNHKPLFNNDDFPTLD